MDVPLGPYFHSFRQPSNYIMLHNSVTNKDILMKLSVDFAHDVGIK